MEEKNRPVGVKPVRLNVGCGRDYRKGWLNWDSSEEVKADKCFDICKFVWPCKDECVAEIYMSGVLEQIAANEDLLFVMNECHRVLEIGGFMTVIVPNARFAIAHRDPMDIRKFTRETFAYFESGAKEHQFYGSVYGFKPWSKIRYAENARHIMTLTLTK